MISFRWWSWGWTPPCHSVKSPAENCVWLSRASQDQIPPTNFTSLSWSSSPWGNMGAITDVREVWSDGKRWRRQIPRRKKKRDCKTQNGDWLGRTSCLFPGKHQVLRQLFREIVACQPKLYQMHCKGDLVMIQHPILIQAWSWSCPTLLWVDWISSSPPWQSSLHHMSYHLLYFQSTAKIYYLEQSLKISRTGQVWLRTRLLVEQSVSFSDWAVSSVSL